MIQSKHLLILATMMMLGVNSGYSQVEGFYKELFMDGGVNLTSRTSLPSADALNLSMEFLATGDDSLQHHIMIENANDHNGVLLYPDGAPRFAMIFTNGGSATNHGNSLQEAGRDRIREFYSKGGSYAGSCAGAFIASLSYMSTGIYEPYYHIWPGRTATTGLLGTYTGHFIPEESPLLDYYSFGYDFYIDNVYHNGGAYARENLDFPSKTEILLRYDYPDATMHEKASCWAHKSSYRTGRLVVIGSHPESVRSGERLDLMKAILSYALDGKGDARRKAKLYDGEPRIMDKSTVDDDPPNTKIGDRQYHHFTIEVPEEANNLEIELSGDNLYDLYLYAAYETFAFKDSAEFINEDPGANKSLRIENADAGIWYISVKCNSTIQATKTSWGYSYSGNLSILNGVAYTITAKWDTLSTAIVQDNMLPKNFELFQNYPNPFNPSTTIQYSLKEQAPVKLAVYDINGREIALLVNEFQNPGDYRVVFKARNLASGVYFYQLQIGNLNSFTQRMIKLD